jgi:NIMA-interacting peptidyl-prolyl cis-trans isomerase 4
MAPKNKSAKSKDEDASGSKGKGGAGGKLKPATSINVRHILCEKHSKKEQALEALREGRKFDDVAREFSEDKARQGTLDPSVSTTPISSCLWGLGERSKREGRV